MYFSFYILSSSDCLENIDNGITDLEDSAQNSLNEVAKMSEMLIEQVMTRRFELEEKINKSKQVRSIVQLSCVYGVRYSLDMVLASLDNPLKSSSHTVKCAHI